MILLYRIGEEESIPEIFYRVYLECSDRVTALVCIITDDALHIPSLKIYLLTK